MLNKAIIGKKVGMTQVFNADGKVIPCAPEDGTQIICDASDPRLKEWLSNDPRLADAKVELTFANMDAKGCQPSIQSPEALVTGKLPKGERGSDALGQYSNKGQLSDKLGSYK